LTGPKTSGHGIFRVAWWSVNALLVMAIVCLVYSSVWEYSVRQYLRGFSDALIPAAATPEQKVEAILTWMRSGPQRPVASNPEGLSKRDPETTLNYRQLLSVCGTATNAFLNLSRSSGLSARRLLLLTPEHNTKHVVAEVQLDEKWVVVDPTYRLVMRDAQGHLLSRRDLHDPTVFAEAISQVPGYPTEYNYQNFAHVRIARLPMQGLGLRRLLDRVKPGWDEEYDWSLLLERESFFILFVSGLSTIFFLLLRFGMGWHADHRLLIPRFQLRAHAARAGAAFLSTPEIKQ
jgi:transglutaminase-like putative cysteine protease